MAAIEDLSLLGLFSRIEEIDQLKSYSKSNEEDTATIASEGSVKKLIATEIGAAPSTGLGSSEKAKAKDFLQKQLKAVDPHDKHASLRRDKISELLQGVEQAAGREAPEHVKRGKDAMARVKRESKDINETYAKWEKGKVMFKTNDELKAMQKQYADMEKCLEATQTFVDDMLKLARSDARPPPLPVQGSTAARPKAKTAAARMADPTVRVGAGGGGGGGGGYPGAKARSTPSAMVSNAALRQAQLAAELRAADVEPQWAAEAPRAPPRAPARAKQEEPDTVVLSYSCTCKAVSEICGISVDKAKDLAESSRDFQKHLNPGDWLLVKERSLAIEKENKEREREKEQMKKDKAQNKLTEKLGQTLSAAATVQISSNRSAVPVAKSAGVKPKPAPKKPPPKKIQSDLAQRTAFSGMQSDSDDDGGGGGWNKVGR